MIISDPEYEYVDSQEAEFICFGGTFVCATINKLKNPISGRLQQIVEVGTPDYLRERYKDIVVRDSKLFGDSSQLRADPDLMQMVSEVRQILERTCGKIFVVMGTDQAAAGAHVLAEGISSEELGDRSIIILVSQTNIPERELQVLPDGVVENSEPGRVLENGLYLGLRKELSGRIAVLGGSTLYPARGLRKVNTKTDDPFSCRFESLGNREGNRWQLYAPERSQAAVPRGNGDECKLSMGVEMKDLGITATYRNLYEDVCRSIPGWFARTFLKKKSHYEGLVLNAPGEGSVREYPEDIEYLVKTAHIAARHNIPMVLVGDPQQPEHPLLEEGDEHYTGAFARVQHRLYGASTNKGKAFVSGGKITPTEMRLLMAAAIARRVDIDEYIDQYVDFLRGMDS
ncbi:MAG: hypothetical protein AAB544_01985 [Patescibacteria group bacterium]